MGRFIKKFELNYTSWVVRRERERGDYVVRKIEPSDDYFDIPSSKPKQSAWEIDGSRLCARLSTTYGLL